MKARKLPSGRWNCSVFSHMEDGKRKYASFTAETKAEAMRQALEYKVNKKNENKPQDLTIEKVVDKYIDSKSNVISPSTLKEYLGYKKYYLNLANIKIGSLNSMDLQNFINDISKDKSPKTVRNIYGLLISAIKMYSDRNYRVTLPQRQNPERNIPTDADIKNLLANANKTLKLAIILGSQGLRRGEICALKYSDILYDFNAIYIHADMVLGKDGWVYKPTAKTSTSTRRVVLPKEVIDLFQNGNKKEDDYILGVLPSTITSDFINLRNKLGLKCRFHDLRHYSASIMHSLGVPDVYIMERNGWRSDKTLKSIYRNSLSDKSAHFTSIANDYFTETILNARQNAERES